MICHANRTLRRLGFKGGQNNKYKHVPLPNLTWLVCVCVCVCVCVHLNIVKDALCSSPCIRLVLCTIRPGNSECFIWKGHNQQHAFPSVLDDDTVYQQTYQRYKFNSTLRLHRTYFRLLMLKWGQLHIWDPESKTSPLVESSQSVSVGSSPNQLRMWSSVRGSNKCRQTVCLLVMMQEVPMQHGSGCKCCSHEHMSSEGATTIISLVISILQTNFEQKIWIWCACRKINLQTASRSLIEQCFANFPKGS